LLAREVEGQLSVEGTPSAPSADVGIEGVFSLSRLGFAFDGTRLRPGTVEIAIFKNGGATETGSGLAGFWNRIPGGYSVAFPGGSGYVARISETCRTAIRTATGPSPPPRPSTRGDQGCMDPTITIDFPQAHGVEHCAIVGGQRQCRIETEYRHRPATVTGCEQAAGPASE
jgi:hypothetical protein